MPRKEAPLSSNKFIIVNGIDHKEEEFEKKELKKMYREIREDSMEKLGYVPVKTA